MVPPRFHQSRCSFRSLPPEGARLALGRPGGGRMVPPRFHQSRCSFRSLLPEGARPASALCRRGPTP